MNVRHVPTLTDALADQFTLRWFRDQGNGQAAADSALAIGTTDGIWPIAILPCDSYQDAETKWWWLLNNYGVNATTYHPIVRSES